MTMVRSMILAVILVSAARPLHAQSIDVAVGRAWTDHDRLGDPRTGAVGLVFAPVERVRVRAAYMLYVAKFDGFGVVCAGLVEPGTCPAESLREEGRIHAVRLGATLDLLLRGRLAVGAVAGLQLARATTVTRGRDTGNTLSAAQAMLGGDVGVELSVAPLPPSPLRLRLGGYLAGLLPLRPELVPDGYTPLGGGVAARRLELGLVMLR